MSKRQLENLSEEEEAVLSAGENSNDIVEPGKFGVYTNYFHYFYIKKCKNGICKQCETKLNTEVDFVEGNEFKTKPIKMLRFNTSGLRRHLEKIHPNIYKEKFAKELNNNKQANKERSIFEMMVRRYR